MPVTPATTWTNDRGTRLLIRAGNGNEITPSFYFSLALDGNTGGSTYEWNIANCNQSIMEWDDPLVQEPGAMMGPTVQGIEALIAKDPFATMGRHAKSASRAAVTRVRARACSRSRCTTRSITARESETDATRI